MPLDPVVAEGSSGDGSGLDLADVPCLVALSSLSGILALSSHGHIGPMEESRVQSWKGDAREIRSQADVVVKPLCALQMFMVLDTPFSWACALALTPS